ncbi:hypothetical protein J6590_042711 [Homalodisca vitripennis]|nr:hypothetical protein J6590_042711 [Homalodisca vitripennis]
MLFILFGFLLRYLSSPDAVVTCGVEELFFDFWLPRILFDHWLFLMEWVEVQSAVLCTQAIWTALKPIVMPTLDEHLWMSSENDFSEKWNFPNAVAAIDGKHVIIKAPPHS